jgi:hypothetical protein
MFAIFILKNHPVSTYARRWIVSVCTFPRRKNSLAPGENRTPARPTHIAVTVTTALPRLSLLKTPVLHCVSVQCIEWHSFYFLFPNLHGIRCVFAGTPVYMWAVLNSKIARGAGHNGRLLLPLIASRQMVGYCLKM